MPFFFSYWLSTYTTYKTRAYCCHSPKGSILPFSTSFPEPSSYPLYGYLCSAALPVHLSLPLSLSLPAVAELQLPLEFAQSNPALISNGSESHHLEQRNSERSPVASLPMKREVPVAPDRQKDQGLCETYLAWDLLPVIWKLSQAFIGVCAFSGRF